MATVLSHQQLQQHQHHQTQHLYPIHQIQHHHNNSPQGSLLDNLPQHHQHSLLQQQTQSGHFCKDCGVMFESSTSLEVHLSYHKENLLTRWATQESLDNKSSPLITIANTSTSSPSPRSDHRSSDREINTNTSNTSDSSTSSQQYFNPMESHGQYLPPQYNNNTGDHHMEPTYRPPSGTTAPNSGPNFGPTPVDTHNGGGNNIPYDSFHSSYHPPTSLGHNHQLFSPNPGNNSGPPNNADHQPGGGRGPNGEQAARESAEILDLDSHKVHVYQHQQQQQQQLGLGERPFFHRPYLPHLQLPPPPQQQQPPPPVNGWPTDPHGFGGRFALSPAGYPVEHPPPGAFYAPSMPPTTTAGNGSSPTSYEIIRVENPNAVGYASQHSPMSYPPQPPPTSSVSSVLQSHLQVSNGLSQGFIQQQMHSPYPPVQPPQAVVIKSENSSSSLSPGALPMTKGQRSPQERGGRGAGSTPSAGVKTKGWKGGECKRPKTYNCPACNKWFTSSGHLKRHYGTTLHKNSVKQLGDNPEDIKPLPKGKKAQAKAQAERAQMASRNTSPQMEDSTSNGKSNPVYIPPPMEMNNGGPPNLDLGNKPTPTFSLNPPVPIPSPSSFAPNNVPPGQLGYHPYAPPGNSFIPNQNHNHHHLIPQQHLSPQIAYTNGYALDLVPSLPMYTSGNGYGHPVNNGDGVPLPPFSSVGQSHYEGGPPGVHPNQSQQQQPNPNGHNNMDNGFPPNHQNPNRVTPPYHHPSMQQQQQQQQHQQIISTPSPHNSITGMMNNSGHHETSFDSERDNPNGSPCEIRSDSGSGSMEGSLDGMDHSDSDGGSPNSSNSDFSKEGENTERGSEVLKCPDCSKTFGRVCYLTQHTNSSHSGGKPFKCQTCGKRFPEEPALSDHVAKHGSDKPYKCQLCPKQFNHKTDLRRHNCLHTGEKPFVCNECGKGFIRKDHMTKHSETHRKKTHNNNGSN